MEHMLLDTMYDLPSTDNVQRVVIDVAVIEDGAKPLLVFAESEKKRLGTDNL